MDQTVQMRGVFALDEIYGRAAPAPGITVVVGRSGDDIVFGGYDAQADTRETRLAMRLVGMSGDSCSAQVSSEVVPGSELLIAQCFVGGTSNASSVVVLGARDSADRGKVKPQPSVLAWIDCGVTWFEVVNAKLVIHSSELQLNRSTPGIAHPDLVATVGPGLFSFEDEDTFDKHCRNRPPG